MEKQLTGINYIPLNPEKTEYIDLNKLSEEEKEVVRDKDNDSFYGQLGL